MSGKDSRNGSSRRSRGRNQGKAIFVGVELVKLKSSVELGEV